MDETFTSFRAKISGNECHEQNSGRRPGDIVEPVAEVGVPIHKQLG